MVVPHTNSPKVPWGIFVKVDPVMMQDTSITSASWVLPVLAAAALAVAHVAPKFPGLPQSGWHFGGRDTKEKTSLLFSFRLLSTGSYTNIWDQHPRHLLFKLKL